MLSKQEKHEITDKIGEKIVEFRDRQLDVMMDWISGNTKNQIAKKKYAEMANLTHNQRESINDLLSEAITSAIYDVFEMIEENHEWIRVLIRHKGEEHDLYNVSEKMGSEIVDGSSDGWIPKFSKMGRFVI